MPLLDIVCFYADLGRPYLPLLERMTDSAKRTMPHGRTVLLTPTPSKQLSDLFDVVIDLKIAVNERTLCFARARAMVAYQALSVAKTVYVDPDIEFLAPVPFGKLDVGLMWRQSKADQPVNTGLILARPGCPEFWAKYGNIIAALPKEVHGWWCDQLGFAILLGALHSPWDKFQCLDARVQLIDWRVGCATPEKAADEAWALHYKGARKGEWARRFHQQRHAEMAI